MSDIKQSYSLWSFENRGIETARLLAETRNMGYQGVDIVPEELWPQVIDAGLQVASVTGHNMPDNRGLNDADSASRIEDELNTSIEKAARWSIPVLICFSGFRGQVSDEKGAEVTAETLSRVAPVAERKGVKLAIELLNSKVDHAGYQADHSAWGVSVCEKVASPAVGLLYDIYHMQIMEGDLIRTIGRDHAHFLHYHTAGNPGRGPMTVDQEINYPAVYRAIAATGYQGYIAHEFLPKGNPVDALREAYEQCAGSFRS